MNRNLDGVYFRIEREGRWQNICFSDMTHEEREEMMAGRSEQWLKSLAVHLADVIREIGDQFDLLGGHSEEEQEES